MSSVLLHYLQAMNWLQDEEGQDLVEYALIIAVVSILLVGALTTLRGGIAQVFTDINDTLRVR